MNELEILKYAKELQAAGDPRGLEEIAAGIRAELEVIAPKVDPASVVGRSRLVFPSGETLEKEILGDGTEKVISA